MISNALAKLYDIANSHTDEDITIGLPQQVGFPLRATVTQSSEFTNSGQIKVQSKRFHFLVDSNSLKETGLSLNRGLIIVRVSSTKTYELVLEKSGTFKYNDPNHKRIVLVANEKEC